MTLIIVEGLDRAGKTTKCREIMAEPRTRPKVLINFRAPPKGQDGMVLREIERVYRLAREHYDMDFVLDRGHVSWFMYAHLRGILNTSAYDMQDWEKEHLPPSTTVFYVSAKPLTLVRRDDGESTWTRPTQSASYHACRVELQLMMPYMRRTKALVKKVAT